MLLWQKFIHTQIHTANTFWESFNHKDNMKAKINIFELIFLTNYGQWTLLPALGSWPWLLSQLPPPSWGCDPTGVNSFSIDTLPQSKNSILFLHRAHQNPCFLAPLVLSNFPSFYSFVCRRHGHHVSSPNPHVNVKNAMTIVCKPICNLGFKHSFYLKQGFILRFIWQHNSTASTMLVKRCQFSPNFLKLYSLYFPRVDSWAPIS